MYCAKCGDKLEDETTCSKCGAAVGEKPQPSAIEQSRSDEDSQGQQQPRQRGMVAEIFAKTFSFLSRKPFLLWGLSLLFMLLSYLAIAFSAFIPIIFLPIIFVLTLGMASIFLNGYRGQEVSSADLFSGFNAKFVRNAGGMGWMYLWILIWALIPIAGIVFAIIKVYSYRFVPYILITDPDIKATDALKKSMQQTKGFRLKMFGADLAVYGCLFGAFLILHLLSLIPYLGYLFAVILVLFWIVSIAVLPLILGIMHAAFYDEITKQERSIVN